jgi:hypothetical protein
VINRLSDAYISIGQSLCSLAFAPIIAFNYDN